jgi:hypothetical protein
MRAEMATLTALVVVFVILAVFRTDRAVRRIRSGIAAATTNLTGK